MKMVRTAGRPAKRSRGRNCLVLLGVVLFFIPAVVGIPSVLAYAWLDHELHQPANPGGGTVRVVVRPGSSFNEIAETLHRAGLIDSPLVFDLYARYRHLDRRIEAGAYTLERNLTMEQILLALQQSHPEEVYVTIPEGFTIRKTADMLDVRGLIKGSDYINVATQGRFDFDFLRGRPPGASLEGFLFPETYLVPARQPAATDLVKRQLQEFGDMWNDTRRAQANQRKLSALQVVTLASIIEREAKFDEDRPLVSSVMYNRLAIGMPLQADATVLYAKGVWQATVTYDDRKVNSPYNTYLHPGLPPGPIANPGIKSIDAILRPAQTDYLYYLSDPQGHNHYARTNEEFAKLLKQYGLS